MNSTELIEIYKNIGKGDHSTMEIYRILDYSRKRKDEYYREHNVFSITVMVHYLRNHLE